jgi:hypothetical protein
VSKGYPKVIQKMSKSERFSRGVFIGSYNWVMLYMGLGSSWVLLGPNIGSWVLLGPPGSSWVPLGSLLGPILGPNRVAYSYILAFWGPGSLLNSESTLKHL